VARSPSKRPKSKSVAVLLFVALAACNRERPVSAAPKPKPKPKTAAAAEPQAEAGDVMPAYSAKLLDGKSFDVASEKGNVVLLNVWATWCGPCRFETPELQALHEKYDARGLRVVGVSVDEGGDVEVKKFVAENKVTYPIAIDAEGRVASVLRTTVLPTTVLIGRNGRIVWRKIGPVLPNETAALDTLIEKTLKSSGGRA
jgi:cytochrome c biogenesis protein CcmG/thiol:disulfide interchange protein DsbE